jgi:uracil-DNA glycosylase family 4
VVDLVVSLKQELADIACDLETYVRYLKSLGLTDFPVSHASRHVAVPQEAGSPEDTLDLIRRDLDGCRRCGLYEGRKNIVFGSGNPQARLVLVGEGPGYEEDLQGRPFVGPAGQLLTKILRAIDLTRDDVYICNIVKCRPPGNRNPERQEIECCLPFLRRQICAIRPKLICALGNIAAQTLLETDMPISRLRGDFHKYGDIPLMPTYHPAFLLRNPEKKRDVWQDVQKIRAAYDKA